MGVTMTSIYCPGHPDVIAVRYLRSTKRSYCPECWAEYQWPTLSSLANLDPATVRDTPDGRLIIISMPPRHSS